MKGYLIFPVILFFSYFLIFISQGHWAAILIFFIWFMRCLRTTFFKKILTVFIFLIAFTYFPLNYHLTKDSVLTEGDSQFYVLPDLTTMKVDGDRLQFRGNIKKGNQEENAVFFYRLESEEEKNKYINYTKAIPLVIEGEMEAPQPKSNFHQFDYKEYLKRRHIFWTIEVSSIKESSSSLSIPWKLKWSRWRASLTYWVQEYIGGVTGKYILTLLLADSQFMDQTIRQDYSRLGIIHLLSISGMHIHFFIDRIRYTLLRIGVSREWLPFIFLSILPFYGVVLGFGVSIFRSIVQNIIKNINHLIGEPFSTLDIWSITLILFLCFRPLLVTEASFQFSFLLSLFLILFAQSEFNKKIPERYEHLILTIFISIISLPILTYHYFEFPWLSILANVFFVPLFSLIILPTLTSVFLFALLFPKGGTLIRLLKVSNFFLGRLEEIIHLLSSPSWISMITGRLSMTMIILLCLGLYFFFYSLSEAQKNEQILLYLSLSVIVFSLFSNRIIWHDEVLMIDIGQGDSILIRKVRGQENILIDTGGGLNFEREVWQKQETPYSTGEDILVPVLKSEGVNTIDKLILSHADADHAGEVHTLAQNIKIKELIGTKQTLSNSFVKDQWLRTRNKQRIILTVIPPLTDFNTEIEQLGWVLWPITERNEDENEHSLVIYAKISHDYWLFTGDVSKQGERQLINLYPNLKVDILKVGHHGSKTSTDPFFVESVQAQKALISAGRNNRFNHPHEEVLDTLRKENIEVYRTDQQGAIRFIYNSQNDSPYLENARKGVKE